MKFVAMFAAFFYLQLSLIITFIPIQIVSLFLLLWFYKKTSLFKALFGAIGASIFSIVVIFLAGITILPFLGVTTFQVLGTSFGISCLLLLASMFIYWQLTHWYLAYILKMRHVALITGASSAIAGLSVLALYYLVWR